MVLTFGFYQLKAQESFRKTYDIPNQVTLKGNETIYLMKTTKVKFQNMSERQKDSIRKLYPLGSKMEIELEEIYLGKKRKIIKEILVSEAFYEQQFILKKEKATKTGISGLIKFEKNKLTINPDLLQNGDGSFTGHGNSYFYELKNRQTLSLPFTEWTINAITIPIKYRFKDESANVAEEFSTSFNANLFLGYTFSGSTYFAHRRDVGNKSNFYKWTFGAMVGFSTVSLNANNTSAATTPLAAGTEIVKGLGSLGLGLTYSFNKINFGAFVGWDYALGEDANKWNYNKEPWLGFALGYSLFQL